MTAIQTIPFAIGLYFSAKHFGRHFTGLLVYWLWISYTLLLLGQLHAWWIPYLFKPDPVRAERYQ